MRFHKSQPGKITLRKLYQKIFIIVLLNHDVTCTFTSYEKSLSTHLPNAAFQEDSDVDIQNEDSFATFPSNDDRVQHKKKRGHLSFLDDMLVDYDKREWPTFGKNISTLVAVNMHINSLGSINAANMEFGLDIYLRQSWLDPRLRTSRFGIKDIVTLNGQDILDSIWKPDLFFRNVKSAAFHMVTVPNKLVKLSPNGTVLFSMRLTLRLSCRMTFRHYPLDTQRCWVIIGPYAQTDDQVKIEWKHKDPITIEDDVELPEFYVIRESPGSFTRHIDTGSFSFLNVSFCLVRQNGFHFIQTYLPTLLIVMISWVSFWLHVDATPARVTLGVTTLLALTTVSSGIRTQLPPVSYIKAIDIWIGTCSVMVFGALLEFTLVNYLSRKKVKSSELQVPINIFGKYRKASDFNGEFQLKEVKPAETEDTQNCQESDKKSSLKRATSVDKCCRVLFPLVFLIFNIIYWSYYLYFT